MIAGLPSFRAIPGTSSALWRRSQGVLEAARNMAAGAMQRAVVTGVLPPDVCRELIWAARSLAVVGYRDCVASATIFEVAAAAPALLMPLVAARQAVRAAAEAALGAELGLLVEFTGLLCWRPGASIGWHHDANRPYLRQRCASAVCYLNTAGADFRGGAFQFGGSQQGCTHGCCCAGGGGGAGGCCRGSGGGGCQGDGSLCDSGDGQAAPLEVHAAPGTVVAYGADVQHRVQPVTAGERYALTLWFTEQPQHDEDTRLLAMLTGPVARPAPPLPPSMWLLPDGADLRLCRLAMAGFGLAWRGRLLRSAAELEEAVGVEEGGEGGGGVADSKGDSQAGAAGAAPPVRLQLAVQPAALRAWREWQAAAPEPRWWELGAVAGGEAAEGATAAAAPAPAPADALAELVAGVEFGSVQEAALAVEHWVWRRGGAASTRELVCSTHLCAAGAGREAAPCCVWLRLCRVAGRSSDDELAGELRSQAAACAARLAGQQAALAAALPRWKTLGALFCEPEAAARDVCLPVAL